MAQSKSIEGFINRKMVVLHEDSTGVQAARAMCEHQIGCVIVTDHESHITGILTDRDLACQVVASELSLETPVRELMTPEIVTVDESASLDTVIALMEENDIRRIPVVRKTRGGSKEKCIGIVTLDDLIVTHSIDFPQLSRIIKKQIYRRPRRTVRPGAAEERSEARMEQKYNSFRNRVAEKTGLERDSADQFIYFVLGCLVRRVNFSEAAQFVSQLPHMLEESLLDLPAGPDRSIDAHSILEGLNARFARGHEKSTQMLHGFWEVLGEMVSQGELQDLIEQLPKEMQNLFLSDTTADAASRPGVDKVSKPKGREDEESATA